MNVDLSGYRILPGLINAHDHLEFALFPRLGNGPYPNATEWARDVYRPHEPPVSSHLSLAKETRLFWGGLRNLLAGVTTVCHHNPYHAVFDGDFPVRVVKGVGWAHSLSFSPDLRVRWESRPQAEPFILHLGEGTDRPSREEVFELDRMGALSERTAIVHGVALDPHGWNLLARRGASVIWCPRSNLFTLGRTLAPSVLRLGVPIALGTDCPITAGGDLLDELRCAASLAGCSLAQLLPLVTSVPAQIFGLRPAPDDWIAVREFGEPPALVMVRGQMQLIDQTIAARIPREALRSMHLLHVAGRPPVYVRTNIAALLRETREALRVDEVRLAGRLVLE